MEKPSFIKHLLGGKTGEKPKKEAPATEAEAAPDMESLTEQAMEVLFGKYEKVIKKADEMKLLNIDQALELLEEAERIVDQMEAIKAGKVLIDDLEKIIDEKKEGVDEIRALTPEGKEVKFELREQLEYWRNFYKEAGVDWAELPEEIKITEEQAKEIERLIEELGFDKMMIIPAGLTGKVGKDGKDENYVKLHEKMSADYNDTYQDPNFEAGGGFEGLRNKSNGLRIIVTKEVQNLKDNELFKQTLGKSVDDLEGKKGIFVEKGVRGIDTATYLVWQREYFKRNKKHLDEVGWTWLTEHERPESKPGRPASVRVPGGLWGPVRVGAFAFFPLRLMVVLAIWVVASPVVLR
ncbi:MAG: hypothetical protein ACOZBH_00005 [Patescibacteria group bacterium]